MVNLDRKRKTSSATTRGTVQVLRQLQESGQPVVLTINGQAEFHIQDATSFQKLLELVDRLETIEAIREGMKEIEDGKGLSFDQVKKAVQRKYGIPS